MSAGAALISGGKLLLELGLAVYEAVKAGETHKTVGEIFADRTGDVAHLDALEEEARAHFEQRPTDPPANPYPEDDE